MGGKSAEVGLLDTVNAKCSKATVLVHFHSYSGPDS